MSETAVVWFLVVALSGPGSAAAIHPVPFATEAECRAALEDVGFLSRCFRQSVDDVQRGYAASGGLNFYSKVAKP